MFEVCLLSVEPESLLRDEVESYWSEEDRWISLWFAADCPLSVRLTWNCFGTSDTIALLPTL
jgi:hypothetical protein